MREECGVNEDDREIREAERDTVMFRLTAGMRTAMMRNPAIAQTSSRRTTKRSVPTLLVSHA